MDSAANEAAHQPPLVEDKIKDVVPMRVELSASGQKRNREECADELESEVAAKIRRGPPRRPCLLPQTVSPGIFIEPLSLFDFA